MSNRTDTSNLDNSLGELRVARHLEAIATSIETFLCSQVDKIDSSLTQCQEAFTQHRLLQERIIEFENQKAAWDESQRVETQRLFEIGEKLIAGWEQLEKERQDLLGEPNGEQHQEG